MPPSCSMNSPENSGERCCKFAAPIQSTLNKSFTVYRRDSRRYEGVVIRHPPGGYGHFCPKVLIAAGRNQSLPPLWQTHRTALRFWGARLERSATPRVSLLGKIGKFPEGGSQRNFPARVIVSINSLGACFSRFALASLHSFFSGTFWNFLELKGNQIWFPLHFLHIWGKVGPRRVSRRH